ncbi:ATP-binding protein [Niallia sp. Krafla_26]|uniref:ATP-binding protein n=1 Tax=Niallia sp. Krafla_26 TaxID=3064703 RepID=UPI003D18250A
MTKLINYFNSSLSHKVFSLIGICFLFFIVATGGLFYFQHKIQDDYLQKRAILKEKQQLIHYIYNQLNTDILVMSDSITIKIPEKKKFALDQENELRKQMNALQPLIETEQERSMYRVIDNFTTYYFTDILFPIMKDDEINEVSSADLKNNNDQNRVKEFLEQTTSYIKLIEEQLNDNAENLMKKQLVIQYCIILFFMIFLVLLLLIIHKIFKNVTKPIANFTHSANEIAAGRDAVIRVDSNRKDELGTLSEAFQKMTRRIQEKEQDLLAHNEELIAQQEELQAQQQELQATLEIISEKEQKLIRRNELINGISSSLNKEKVLQSMVKSMCKVTGADKGIITYLDEDNFASYAVSRFGIEQFRRNLDNGFILRLINEKRPFTVKREQDPKEKGYHDIPLFSYDLYVPILMERQVVAIMMFTRYADPFSESEIAEYDTLARQIAIYLEKIRLFEQSENDRRLNQDILNTVQEGIQLIDRDRKIIQVNQQLREIFKGTNVADELLELSWKQWSERMAGQVQENDFIDSLNELIDSAFLRADEEHSFIYRLNNSNQVIRVYCKSFKNQHNEDYGTLLVHRDITKEYQVAQMKSEFVSTVSHELRTPLASVLGFTELLITKELKPERKVKYLNTIYKEAKRLTALINDFLDVQRMESGKQTYEKKFIDIASILRNVMELQAVHSTLHKMNLSIELEDTIILGDRDKLEQVFTNLLSNAIKYSPDGGNIFIRMYGYDNMISIDFKDEGLGIPEDALPHLFQQFYRVDNSDRRRIGGTGLGLSIVKEIVKAHDGTISVTSEYGKGSVFTTRFPQVSIGAENKNIQEDTMLQYTIMVIEDDLSLAQLLNHELQDNGFHVKHFNNGKKALEQLKMSVPDAIVLDILLEDEIDGWTIMKKIKESRELKDIPIFVSSALDDKELGFSLGAEEYLVKPYKPSHLSKLIMQTLLKSEKKAAKY